jgi:hypothetical protein
VKHSASPRFWAAYEALPASIRKLADANFVLLKRDPRIRRSSSKRSGDIGPSASACAIAPWLLKPMTRVFGSGSLTRRL